MAAKKVDHLAGLSAQTWVGMSGGNLAVPRVESWVANSVGYWVGSMVASLADYLDAPKAVRWAGCWVETKDALSVGYWAVHLVG